MTNTKIILCVFFESWHMRGTCRAGNSPVTASSLVHCPPWTTQRSLARFSGGPRGALSSALLVSAPSVFAMGGVAVAALPAHCCALLAVRPASQGCPLLPEPRSRADPVPTDPVPAGSVPGTARSPPGCNSLLFWHQSRASFSRPALLQIS